MNKKTKRILSLILSSAVMATSLFTTAFAASDIKGDANGDKTISAADASMVMQYVLNPGAFTEKFKGDENINLVNFNVTTDAALKVVTGSAIIPHLVVSGSSVSVDIEAKDAAAIMNKVLNSDFKFIADGGGADTEDTTKPNTDKPTEDETEKPTEDETEKPTENETEEPTENETEKPTETTTIAEPNTETTTNAEPDDNTKPENKSWNISDFENATCTEVTQISGLTLVGSSNKSIVIEENNKEYEGVKYTKRLKLGGTIGENLDRNAIKFDVSGPCTINVYGMSSNSEERQIGLFASNSTSESPLFKSEKVNNEKLQKMDFNYTGEKDTLAIGSLKSGFNIYAIEVVYPESAN